MNYKSVFLYFLKLGASGFGGPLALIAMMQNDLIKKEKWISNEKFQTAFSMIKAMPGPVAFNTAVFLGQDKAGFFGGLLAAIGLVLPAAIMMIILAAGIANLREYQNVDVILNSLQFGALALIVSSLKPLSSGYLKDKVFWVFVLISLPFGHVLGSWEPVLIVGYGLIFVLIAQKKFLNQKGSVQMDLFWVCLKAGTFVFGSGLAIVPMLQADVVDRYHWVTNAEFMNALAFGQITPGPVSVTATFIGYQVAGLSGALFATVGVFLTGFIHMTTWFPMALKWMSKQSWIQSFIRGAMAAVIGTLILSIFKMSASLNWHFENTFIFVVCLILLHRLKVPAWQVIPVAGILGWIQNLLFSTAHL